MLSTGQIIAQKLYEILVISIACTSLLLNEAGITSSLYKCPAQLYKLVTTHKTQSNLFTVVQVSCLHSRYHKLQTTWQGRTKGAD